jgi:hypothetical protein
MTLKCFGANDLTNWALLKPDGAHTEFGHWLTDAPQTDFGAPTTFHLFEHIPTADELRAAFQHPSWDGWVMVGGNEPDLETGKTPTTCANLLRAQMDAVLAVNSHVKFCATLGSQRHAPGTTSPFFPTVWGSLKLSYRSRIRAFHTHYYAQDAFGDNASKIFSQAPIKAFLKKVRAWMRDASASDRELWLSEIGLIDSTLTRTDGRAVLYPQTVMQACDGLADRAAWYILKKRDGYIALLDENNEPTCQGSVFAAL